MFSLFKSNEDIKTEFVFLDIKPTLVLIKQTDFDKTDNSILPLNAISYLIHFLSIYSVDKKIKKSIIDYLHQHISNGFKDTLRDKFINESSLSNFFYFIQPSLPENLGRAIYSLTRFMFWAMDFNDYHDKCNRSNIIPIDKKIAVYKYKFKKEKKFLLNPNLKNVAIYLPISVIGLLDDTYYKVDDDNKKRLTDSCLYILDHYSNISLRDRKNVLLKVMSLYFKDA